MNLINKLQRLSTGSAYWLAYIVGGISLLVVALFYQYQLEEQPCVVCIQIRLWILALILLAVMGLLLRKYKVLNIGVQLAVVLATLGFVERSYLLLGTERGFIFADCGFDAGLPSWFAIEQWLPGIFQVEASCGYTPELMFGVTMAEALMLLSVGLVIISASAMFASLIGFIKNR